MGQLGLKASLSTLAACAMVTGCGTPQPARDLAVQGAATVAMADTEVRAFIDRATHAYKRREAIVRGLVKGEIVDVGNADFTAWLADEAGIPDNLALFNLVKKIAEQSRASRENVQSEMDKKAKEINSTFGAPIPIPEKSLGDAKKAFLALAQELSPQEWLEFSWKYSKQIADDLKALETKNEP